MEHEAECGAQAVLVVEGLWWDTHLVPIIVPSLPPNELAGPCINRGRDAVLAISANEGGASFGTNTGGGQVMGHA